MSCNPKTQRVARADSRDNSRVSAQKSAVTGSVQNPQTSGGEREIGIVASQEENPGFEFTIWPEPFSSVCMFALYLGGSSLGTPASFTVQRLVSFSIIIN